MFRDAGKGGHRGGTGGAQGGHREGLATLALSQGGHGGPKCSLIKYLFKNEQALAEVICVKAESGVIARTEILQLYLLQA